MRRACFAALIGLTVLAAGPPAWAQPNPTVTVHRRIDPFEAMNRGFFAVHQKLDKWFFRPTARLFHALTPGPIGRGVHNVLQNITEPTVIANDLLQFRIGRAIKDTARLTANSTVGLLGLIDIAGPSGLPHHDNDFGITMGRYGIGPGPYLFIPLAGPMTVRDAVGGAVDDVIDPLHYFHYPHRLRISVATTVFNGLDARIQADTDLDTLLGDAADPYATLRSVYLQSRQGLVSESDHSTAPVLDPIDDPQPPPPPETAPAAAVDPAGPATSAPAVQPDPASPGGATATVPAAAAPAPPASAPAPGA